MRKGDDLTTFIVPKVKKIRSLNLLRPVAGNLYLYYSQHVIIFSFFIFHCRIFSVTSVSVPLFLIHVLLRTAVLTDCTNISVAVSGVLYRKTEKTALLGQTNFFLSVCLKFSLNFIR
jgi:hypothetical protein